MAQLSRLNAYNNESQVDLHNQEIGMVIDELNKGVDVSGIGYKAITADKIRILSGQLNFISFGTVNAGTSSEPVYIRAVHAGAQYEGSIYLITHYEDYFVDPTDLTNLYNNPGYPRNSKGAGVGFGGGAVDAHDKMIPSCILRNSVNTSVVGDVAEFIMQVYNSDSASHAYYATFGFTIAATQLTAGSS